MIADPLVSALISYSTPEEANDTVEMSGFEFYDVLLLEINNNSNGTAVYAGEHWSFLAIFKNSENSKISAFHCCSVGRTIPESGKKIVERLAVYLNAEYSITELCASAKQKNSFDCGLYALFFTQIAVEVLEAISDHLTPESF